MYRETSHTARTESRPIQHEESLVVKPERATCALLERESLRTWYLNGMICAKTTVNSA
jgi:hypothetical protein